METLKKVDLPMGTVVVTGDPDLVEVEEHSRVGFLSGRGKLELRLLPKPRPTPDLYIVWHVCPRPGDPADDPTELFVGIYPSLDKPRELRECAARWGQTLVFDRYDMATGDTFRLDE